MGGAATSGRARTANADERAAADGGHVVRDTLADGELAARQARQLVAERRLRAHHRHHIRLLPRVQAELPAHVRVHIAPHCTITSIAL